MAPCLDSRRGWVQEREGILGAPPLEHALAQVGGSIPLQV